MKYKNIDEFYYCYSLNLFHFLKANNFWYKYKELLPETNRYVFVFPKTKELMDAITYYTNEKRIALNK